MRFTIPNKQNLLLAAILGLAAALRLYKPDFQSLWLDEVLTMNSANPKLSLKEMYDSVMNWEFIPHLYFFLNRIAFSIFGYSSLVARILSGIIGVLGVYAIYLLGKELFSKKTGLIAALLLAVNIYHISYSQEVRPYGMLFLFSVLSFYRLVILIRESSVKNAVYYGIFTGLILNAHFFGAITIFSQGLILLYFLSLKPKAERMIFFKNMLIAAGAALLFALPALEPFIRVTEIKSFWMPTPGDNVYSFMFGEFFGKTEMLLYALQFIVAYYGITLFRQKLKEYSYGAVVGNKVIFSSVILLVWLFISLTIPLIKSHLGASMMVSRYFITLIAIVLLIAAIGLSLIRSKPVLTIVLSCFVLFSLADIFIIKDYYNKVVKTQLREFTTALKDINPDKARVVTMYSWILPYYFQNEPETLIVNNTLEKHVTDMKSGALPVIPFWYTDFNLRPYELSTESQAYLDANFVTAAKMEYFDIWGNYYVPKSYKSLFRQEKETQYVFQGTKNFFENSAYESREISLSKGHYKVIINGLSTPKTPIQGQNAHFKVLYKGKKIGEIYLSEKQGSPGQAVLFNCEEDMVGKIELIYDNDLFADGQDRNAIIYSVKITKDK